MSIDISTAPLSLTHLNIDVRDLDTAQRFYGETLGLPIERRDDSLKICTANYLFVLYRGEPQVGGSFHFGFRVSARNDVDAWFERLRAAHVSVLVEPCEAGPVYVGRIADPDGYEIEIYTDL